MNFFHTEDHLQQFGTDILETTWREFPQLAQEQIALTWIVYDPPVIVNTGGAISHEEFWKYSPRGFSYRGQERTYPASLVKLSLIPTQQLFPEQKQHKLIDFCDATAVYHHGLLVHLVLWLV